MIYTFSQEYQKYGDFPLRSEDFQVAYTEKEYFDDGYEPISIKLLEKYMESYYNPFGFAFHVVTGEIAVPIVLVATSILEGVFKGLTTLVNNKVLVPYKNRNLDKEDMKRDIIRVSYKDFFLVKDEIKQLALKLIDEDRKFNIVIDYGLAKDCLANIGNKGEKERVEYDHPIHKMLEIFDFNQYLKRLGMKQSIKFNEFETIENYGDLKSCWDIEQVLEANSEINKIVNKIKDSNFSPLEAMVYIHKYITTNYKYGFNAENHSKKDWSRSIVGAVKFKKMVCAGYSSMTKAIIDNLEMSGLKCKDQCVYTIRGWHALNFVQIQDEKYNVSGQYANDACWDAKDEFYVNGKGYGCFMYPMVDMGNFVGEATFIPVEEKLKNWKTNWTYWQKEIYSHSIPLEKTIEAIRQVYSKEEEFHKGMDVETRIKNDIKNSREVAEYRYRCWAENPFVKKNKILE